MIAPAVCRMMAARPSAVSAQAHRTNPAASTAPSTPGWARDNPGAGRKDRLDECEAPERQHFADHQAAAPTTAACRQHRPALRHRGEGGRIRPPLYSEVNCSTASTLTGITVYSA